MSDLTIALYAYFIVVGIAAFASFLALGESPGSRRRFGGLLVALALGVFFALGKDEYRVVVFGVRTDGTVVGFHTAKKSYRPVVRFVAADGTVTEFRSKQSVRFGELVVGQGVPVYFLESDPTAAVVATVAGLWRPLFFGTGFGVVLVAVGGGVMCWRPKPRDTDVGFEWLRRGKV